ncbi:MAG: NAD-dependent epimerase/dehydratase [Burkholderiales bacterium]|nr:NAD-dependent epimerase/dehydratase [Burkholderiales bacterium]
MNESLRTCLLTGAGGFVGSRLAARLHGAGCTVCAITRTGESIAGLPYVRVVGSSESQKSVEDALHASRPDVVFHLAAEVIPEHGREDIERLLDGNVRFALHLLEGMRLQGCRAMVNASTGWQHYRGRDYDPVCLYAATKQAAEDLMEYYANACEMRICSLVMLDNYGSGDPRQKLFYWLRKAAGSQDPIAFSAGEQLLDLVHVDDVARAFVVAGQDVLSRQAGGHTRFRVGSSRQLRLRELAARYEQISGRPLNIAWGARAYRVRELMCPPDTPALLPGWEARIEIEQGLREMVEEATALGAERARA